MFESNLSGFSELNNSIYKKKKVRKKKPLLVKKEIINVMTDMNERKQKDSTVVM